MLNESAHLDLSNGQVQEGHVVSDLDDGLGTDTTHGGTETTVELEDGKLVEDGGVDVLENLVLADLLRLGGLDTLPVAGSQCAARLGLGLCLHLLALGSLGKESVEEEEEGLHLSLEDLASGACSNVGHAVPRWTAPSTWSNQLTLFFSPSASETPATMLLSWFLMALAATPVVADLKSCVREHKWG